VEDLKRAVVLLSGGMDSAVTLAVAQHEGFDPIALVFRYGQRHESEIQSAQAVALRAGVRRFKILDIDLVTFGGSALTDRMIAVPKHDRTEDIGEGIPPTYVPARNTIFLAYALALAETTGAEAIFIGVNAQDRAGYPDCRPEYIEAFNRMAELATAGHPVTVRAPLSGLTKADIVSSGLFLGVDFALTSSCYDPRPGPCGRCDACLLRAEAFATAGIPDPAVTS
jgi:7-cyano-7-deazaguanine synthase